ncbi:MAG TPA: hypothetical protein VK892_16110 [Pyrinomonadaceae bacterium]|nr:hypothetical protein [Pyrinomonadaceae bacterium]
MLLFTAYFEYDGGTYISQVTAPDHNIAIQTWAEEFKLHRKKDYKSFFEKDFRKKLLKSVNFDVPVEIEGVSKCWCISLIYLDKPALIHLIQTFED